MGKPDRVQIDAARVQALFDAIAEGNLMRVKAFLAEEPDLLFADYLDGRASPAREALHSEQFDIADYLAREELRQLGDDTVPRDDIYGAIHDLGEVAHAETGYPLAEQLRAEAEPVVVQFLRHDDESFRYIALNVLGLHWDLRTHRETFAAMMFDDPDDAVRRLAVACLGFVLRGSRDWEATKPLLHKLRDQDEQDSTRETAYEALLDIWFGWDASHRHFLEVMKARSPLDSASREASAREEYDLSLRLGGQSDRIWEDHVDSEFIAKLERGEEP